MKTFFKIFSIAFLCFVIIFSGIVWSFNRFMKDSHKGTDLVAKAVEWDDKENLLKPEETDVLKRLVRESPRINTVLLGLDGPRSDTMIFISYNPETKKLDMISIPRDTYYHREGYDRLDKRKINSVYGDHGANGAKTVVSDVLLDVPVDYYVTVTYKGVEAIINSLGGVPIFIPEEMKYNDNAGGLNIYFPPGYHVLNGEDSVKFLRYRGYPDADLGRVRAQQAFVEAAIKQAMGFRLPVVATNVFRHVRTDMELQEIIYYASTAIGMNTETIDSYTLPGEAKYRNNVSFYFHDVQSTRDLLIKIYAEGEVISEENSRPVGIDENIPQFY